MRYSGLSDGDRATIPAHDSGESMDKVLNAMAKWSSHFDKRGIFASVVRLILKTLSR
jgi:hypothetical protein